jgi:hypothetical protein
VCKGLLLHAITLNDTRHTRQESSGRGIVPSQRPLADSTQRSQEKDVHAPVGFEPANPTSERQQTHALDWAATEIGHTQYKSIEQEKLSVHVS